LGERTFSNAWGKNKKEAEQRAAGNALLELGQISPDEALESV
jgi:dsRNA-specific ribonuclease